MAEERPTVLSILRKSEEYLRRAGVESPRLDAEVLLAHVLGWTRLRLYTGFDRPLDEAELAACRKLVRARAERRPAAYLTGVKEFHSLSFQVTPDVLIPRPETEHLVEAVVARAKGAGPVRILDLGTGSGCIAVSLAVELSEARIVAVDVSEAAVAVARANAERHGAADRIDFRRGEWFEPVRDEPPFDYIVSNPPYVGRDEEVDPEVRAEPAGAVFAPGDPVEVYAALLSGAGAALTPAGRVLLELPGSRLAEIRARVPAGLEVEEVVNDYHGLPRVLVVRRPSPPAG